MVEYPEEEEEVDQEEEEEEAAVVVVGVPTRGWATTTQEVCSINSIEVPPLTCKTTTDMASDLCYHNITQVA